MLVLLVMHIQGAWVALLIIWVDFRSKLHGSGFSSQIAVGALNAMACDVSIIVAAYEAKVRKPF